MTIRWRSVRLEEVTVYIILVCIAALNAVLQPNFFTSGNLFYTFQVSLPICLASVGAALVILTAQIDLSIGALASLANVSVALLAGSGLAVVLPSVIALGVVAGGIVGVSVAYARLPSLIVTLAISSVWFGIALVLMPNPQSGSPAGLSDLLSGPIPVFIVLAIILAWRWYSRTTLGIRQYAVGVNKVSAYVAGVPVERTQVLTFCLAGAFIALSGITLTGLTGGGDPLGASSFTMEAITAAILGGVSFQGGKGSIIGAIAGAFALTLLTNVVFFLGASSFLQDVIYGVVLIVALSIGRLTAGRHIRVPMFGFADRRGAHATR